MRTIATCLAALLVVGCSPPAALSNASRAVSYTFDVVQHYPHETDAFTQGLIYREGFLYESTGLIGQSTLRKVRLETGEVLQQRRLDDHFFGEGLTEWRGQLIQLTPARTEFNMPPLSKLDELPSMLPVLSRKFGINIGSTYDVGSFEPRTTFSYKHEGWGLTVDDHRLIMSDGTSKLRFLHPDTFAELGELAITDGRRPIQLLNELEFINGAIYANVWFEDRIAVINPTTGQVTAWIDLSDLKTRFPVPAAKGSVLNGIAYDKRGDRLFVTGKLWPRVFEIRVKRQ